MSDSEEQGVSGTYTGMKLQGGPSSPSPSPRGSGGAGVVIGGGGEWRVNKEITLPILMGLKESLEAEIRQVESLINMVHGGEEVLAAAEEEEEDDHIACQREIQKKALADEQDRSLELQMQIEVMKLTLSCGFIGAGTAASY